MLTQTADDQHQHREHFPNGDIFPVGCCARRVSHQLKLDGCSSPSHPTSKTQKIAITIDVDVKVPSRLIRDEKHTRAARFAMYKSTGVMCSKTVPLTVFESKSIFQSKSTWRVTKSSGLECDEGSWMCSNLKSAAPY